MVTLPITRRFVGKHFPESFILYRAYLVPNKADLLSPEIDEKLAEKIIYRIIDGGETSVIAGKPIHYNLVELYKDAGLDIPPGIKQKLETYGFYLLHLTCSFRSHTDTPHPFVLGEMKAKFSNLSGPEQPIIFDLCPLNISDTAHIEKEFGLSISGNFMSIIPSVQYKSVVKFDEITPIVRAFGKHASEGGWDYTTSRSRSEIKGIHEGFILLMFPKYAQIKVAIDIRAKVKEKFFQRVSPYSRKWKIEDFADQQEMEIPLYRSVPITEKELSVPRKVINDDIVRRWTEGFGDLIYNRHDLSDNEKSFVLD